MGTGAGRRSPKVRAIIHDADPEIVEEWKWVKPTNPGTPVWSHGGIVCTGETYKNVVKMTFARGAELKDPSGLFNSSLDGNVRRAIDIHEGDTVDEAALKYLIRAAVALNLKDKSKSTPKPRAAAPVCTPTRCALATGRYPQRTEVGLHEALTARDRDEGLPPDPLDHCLARESRGGTR
jgi:hypothetical protein